jgi:hypothetical protein
MSQKKNAKSKSIGAALGIMTIQCQNRRAKTTNKKRDNSHLFKKIEGIKRVKTLKYEFILTEIVGGYCVF